MAAPAAAACTSWACSTALAPTSTPCVGSSSRNTAGSRRSHLANMIFCWLPPLNDSRGRSTRPGGRTLSRSNQLSAVRRSGRRHIVPNLRNGRRLDSAMFSRAERLRIAAFRTRSAGR